MMRQPANYAEGIENTSSLSGKLNLRRRLPFGSHWPMGDVVLQYRQELPKQSSLAGVNCHVLDVVHMVFPPDIAETFQLTQNDMFGNVGSGHPDIEPGYNSTVMAFKHWRGRFFDLPGSEVLYWGVCDSPPNTVIALLCVYFWFSFDSYFRTSADYQASLGR